MGDDGHIERMYAADRASQGLGVEIVSMDGTTATVRMRVRPDMLNGHGFCHGGFIFAMADSAFAFSSNACGRVTVAAECTVTFLRPVTEGEELTATAVEVSRGRTAGVYDVTVSRADGKPVALFRGYAMEPRSGGKGGKNGQEEPLRSG